MRLKITSFEAVPAHMAALRVIAHDQGISRSGLLRQLIVKEIRRAAKEASSAKQPATLSYREKNHE